MGIVSADSSITNVQSGELVLEGGNNNGGIGTATDHIIIDVADPDTLTARAAGEIYITEATGNMGRPVRDLG